MKNKIPFILLLVALVLAAAIVIKGTADKNKSLKDNREYAQSISENADFDASDSLYEYYQTNPENGLAVIYTFEIFEEKDGKASGKIEICGNGTEKTILCGVKKEADIITFIYADSESDDDFSKGDELVRLHKREKALVPEFVKLEKVIPGEELIRNY